jgi:hypothetical protein
LVPHQQRQTLYYPCTGRFPNDHDTAYHYIQTLSQYHHPEEWRAPFTYEDQGAEKAIQMLGAALLIGSIFILPALFYLIWSFQYKPEQADSDMH